MKEPLLWYRRDGTPCPAGEAMELMQNPHARIVKQETLPTGYWLSTVFLVIDHNCGLRGPPILFETMVFESEGNPHSLDCLRYATEKEAREGHEWMKRRWTLMEEGE